MSYWRRPHRHAIQQRKERIDEANKQFTKFKQDVVNLAKEATTKVEQACKKRKGPDGAAANVVAPTAAAAKPEVPVLDEAAQKAKEAEDLEEKILGDKISAAAYEAAQKKLDEEKRC